MSIDRKWYIPSIETCMAVKMNELQLHKTIKQYG